MSTAYLGQIRIFPAEFEPAGWLFCNGQLAQISDYMPLFVILRTVYGGDNQVTFGMPTLPDPAPGCHYIICTEGIYPTDGPSPPDGTTSEVTLFAGWELGENGFMVPFVPGGWLHCDGSSLPLPASGPASDLFALIQTRFGGDGRTSFALPRLDDLAQGVGYIICVEGTVPTKAS